MNDEAPNSAVTLSDAETKALEWISDIIEREAEFWIDGHQRVNVNNAPLVASKIVTDRVALQLIRPLISNIDRAAHIAEGGARVMQSWQRSLDNRLYNKTHLIDALALTTQRLQKNDAAMRRLRVEMLEDLERANVETVIMGQPITPIDLQKYIALIGMVTTT